jgi:RNA polymerase-binding transcription factor DksA
MSNNGNKVSERRTPFSDEELEEFRELILRKRAEALEEVENLRTQLEDSREHEGDSAYSFHMADAGTDAMEREKLYLMVARQQKFVGYLDRALERIDNKTYGRVQGHRQAHPEGAPARRAPHRALHRGQAQAEVGVVDGSLLIVHC